MKYGAKGAAIFFKMILLVFKIVFKKKQKKRNLFGLLSI